MDMFAFFSLLGVAAVVSLAATFIGIAVNEEMANTPEKKVKQKMAKYLKEMGAYYFFPATGGFGRSGVPDIICCVKGMFVAIECKAGGNTTTALQDREIEEIRKHGGSAWVVNEDNVDEIAAVLFCLSEQAVPGDVHKKVDEARKKTWSANPYSQGVVQNILYTQQQNAKIVAHQGQLHNMKMQAKIDEMAKMEYAKHEKEKAMQSLEKALKQQE